VGHLGREGGKYRGRDDSTSVSDEIGEKKGGRKGKREGGKKGKREGGREGRRVGGKEGRGRTCLREETLLKFRLPEPLIFPLFGPILLSLPPILPPALPPALSGSNPATGAAPACRMLTPEPSLSPSSWRKSISPLPLPPALPRRSTWEPPPSFPPSLPRGRISPLSPFFYRLHL